MGIIVVEDEYRLIRKCPWDIADTGAVSKCPFMEEWERMDCLFCKHATLTPQGEKEKLREMERIDREIDEKAEKSIEEFEARKNIDIPF